MLAQSFSFPATGRQSMFHRLLRWLGFGQGDAPAPDERLDKMNAMLVQVDRLRRLIGQHTWKGRRGTWRTSKLESVHPNIFYLINTVRSTTDAVISKSPPPREAILSRKFMDNLYPVTLDGYLTDEQGLTCPPETIMRELIKAIEDLVNNIRMYDQTDSTYYDYYLRQCSTLFGELEIITKTYL
jgi:hypothetical protein